ncbi:formate/nitrite transporter family protein [Erythrobacter sp. 3-20A1M]|uniref:formate/nitrite transporter family protein n=1 Tax=Erythrobacter sp. 3-20A1M TaxID=2653850 RepID=UPI001BFC5E24|nr:formate/nitrite transporter family protein [Erythrobacter sp. 3-20A1M]QWC57142.1 formate/nitrite transporter family protein [Erythrobacter sp. 3-20A1M]
MTRSEDLHGAQRGGTGGKPGSDENSHPLNHPQDGKDDEGQEGEDVSHPPEEGEAVSDYFGFTEIFKRVLSTADHELDVSNLYLFWSALGAGGALGLTFLARVIFTESAGEIEPGLLGNLLYPVGFLIIVLGRYQLFTENTLTPVVLVLTRLASLRDLLRLWLVVFVGNMVGAIAFAAAIAYSNVFTPERAARAMEIGHHAIETEWLEIFYRGIIAGWIVAAMVWLVHAMRDSIGRALVIYVLMYFIGVGTFFHVITSSVEAFYIAFADPTVNFWVLWPNFVAPVLIGNTLGGIIFVAVLNYAQFAEHKDSRMFERYERMSMKQWLFGHREHY